MILFVGGLLFSFSEMGAGLDNNVQRFKTYIKKYAPMAIRQMEEHRIPASIILAQAILESNAGASRLARRHKNHFGIKCHDLDCEKGHCVNYKDDSYLDYFRNFQTIEESYAAHSVVLQKPWYLDLYEYDSTDYKSWAKGLEKAGYSTDENYARKLISIIERFKLNQYDKVVSEP